MNREQHRQSNPPRQYRVEAVPRQSPDLSKLAQVFMGMAVTRAENERQQKQTLNTCTESDSS
jgi:hypothetical protein